MRILFLGDASAVHYNLSVGLRERGHEAVVISSKIGWRNYPQDILMDRKEGRVGALKYLLRVLRILPRLRGFDVVQLVGPHFLDLKSERLWKIFNFLRKHNKRIVLAALGDDYYWAVGGADKRLFRYGDFNIGEEDRRQTFPYARKVYDDWTLPLHHSYNEYLAQKSDGIVAVLYEYWKCYQAYWQEKTAFIPLPVIPPEQNSVDFSVGSKVRFFIGIQKERSAYKGTDIILQAAQDIVNRYPQEASLQVVQNVPYAEYLKMMEGYDVILDQLYSYTPAMNALEAMSRGLVVVGGGEPENYEIIGEEELRPIINVLPNYQSVYDALEQLVQHKDRIPELKRQSVEYVLRHHHYRQVAARYEEYYTRLLAHSSHHNI